MSARRTYDTDNITLRTIYVRGAQNTEIPSTSALTADGVGGTRWTHPSSLGTYTFNFISTDVSLLASDLSLNNVLYLNGGQGIGIQSSIVNPRQTAVFYSKAYQAFNITNSGAYMMATDNGTGNLVNSTINLSTTSHAVFFTLDSTLQTLYLNTNPMKILVPSQTANISSVTSSILASNIYPAASEISYESTNSTIRFLGLGDIQLSTLNFPQKAVFFGISTFTSRGYLSLSGDIYTTRNIKSSVGLTTSNSLIKTPTQPISYLSTFYTAYFTAGYTGGIAAPPDAPLICTIVSSLGFPYYPAGLRGPSTPIQSFVDGPPANPYTANIYEYIPTSNTIQCVVSSLTLNLQPYSTIISKYSASTSVLIDYKPKFNFRTTALDTNLQIPELTVSSFMTYGEFLVPGSAHEEYFYPSNLPTATALYVNNPYSGNLTLPLNLGFVLSTNYISNYVMQHSIPGAVAGYSNANGAWPPTQFNVVRSGLSSTAFYTATGQNNSAFVSILQ